MHYIVGMEIVKTLGNFKKLYNLALYCRSSLWEDTNQSIGICMPIVLDIIQNSAVLHPWRNHAKAGREAVTVNSYER
jgi:hypothetical protein